MNIYHSFSKVISPPLPCAVTIGNFDGMHQGHQALLSFIRKEIGPHGTLVIVTFSNHPSHILPNRPPVPLIAPEAIKLQALQHASADIIYSLEFTPSLAKKTYHEFLQELHHSCPFSHLILGKGAAIGKKERELRKKSKSSLKALALPLNTSKKSKHKIAPSPQTTSEHPSKKEILKKPKSFSQGPSRTKFTLSKQTSPSPTWLAFPPTAPTRSPTKMAQKAP